MLRYSHKFLAPLFVLLFSYSCFAQVDLDSVSRSSLIDFESSLGGVLEGRFAGVGFDPSPLEGQLDSDAWSINGFSDGDLSFGGSAVSGDLARGAISGGGTSTGGLYALADFPGKGGSSIAFQPGGSDFTPGVITLKVRNIDPKQILVGLTLSFDIYELNDASRSSFLRFSYSTDGMTWSSVPDLDHVTPEAADAIPSFQKIGKAGPSRTWTISPVAIGPNGGELLLRWESDDFSGTGSRDELAIDNISLNGEFLGTTAAQGTIEGQAVDQFGRPVSLVWVVLTGKGLDEPRVAVTNPFGRFRFEGLPVGRSYLLEAGSGRYVFETPVVAVTLNTDLATVSFVAGRRSKSEGFLR